MENLSVYHGLRALKKTKVMAVVGIILPLPMIALAALGFNYFQADWYKDPFIVAIFVVFAIGQIVALFSYVPILEGIGKCKKFLKELAEHALDNAQDMLEWINTAPSGHLQNMVKKVLLGSMNNGVSAQTLLDSYANRRSARTQGSISFQAAINRTTLKLGFLGTLVGLLLTFPPMKSAILALKDSGGEMKFVNDIALAIDGDQFAIFTTLLATGLSLVIEMITLQIFERTNASFERMNNHIDEFALVDLEPRIKNECSKTDIKKLAEIQNSNIQKLFEMEENISKAQSELAKSVAASNEMTLKSIDEITETQDKFAKQLQAVYKNAEGISKMVYIQNKFSAMLQSAHKNMSDSQLKLGETMANSEKKMENIARIQEVIGKRVDKLVEYDREIFLNSEKSSENKI